MAFVRVRYNVHTKEWEQSMKPAKPGLWAYRWVDFGGTWDIAQLRPRSRGRKGRRNS